MAWATPPVQSSYITRRNSVCFQGSVSFTSRSSLQVHCLALHNPREVRFSLVVHKDSSDDHQAWQTDSWILPSPAEAGSRWGSGPDARPLRQPDRHDAGHHGPQPVVLQCQTDDREGSRRTHPMKMCTGLMASGKDEAKLKMFRCRRFGLYPSITSRDHTPRAFCLGVLLL